MVAERPRETAARAKLVRKETVVCGFGDVIDEDLGKM